MCTVFDNREKNEDLEGNHCVIVFAAADLLRPLAAKLWFSLLGDTGLPLVKFALPLVFGCHKEFLTCFV